MVWRALFFALVTLSAAAGRAKDNAAEIAEGFRQQRQCWDEWGGVIDGWLRQGGFAESMRTTRSRIARDRQSTFAAIVRAAWARQQRPKSEAIGAWPIADDDFRIVGDAIEAATGPFIRSKHCRSSAWLEGLVWDALRNRGTHAKRLTDMPATLDTSDAHTASIWTMYWLFVRRETDA
jgi:hypothetical protein